MHLFILLMFCHAVLCAQVPVEFESRVMSTDTLMDYAKSSLTSDLTDVVDDILSNTTNSGTISRSLGKVYQKMHNGGWQKELQWFFRNTNIGRDMLSLFNSGMVSFLIDVSNGHMPTTRQFGFASGFFSTIGQILRQPIVQALLIALNVWFFLLGVSSLFYGTGFFLFPSFIDFGGSGGGGSGGSTSNEPSPAECNVITHISRPPVVANTCDAGCRQICSCDDNKIEEPSVNGTDSGNSTTKLTTDETNELIQSTTDVFTDSSVTTEGYYGGGVSTFTIVPFTKVTQPTITHGHPTDSSTVPTKFSAHAILKACLQLGGEVSACVSHAKLYGSLISKPNPVYGHRPEKYQDTNQDIFGSYRPQQSQSDYTNNHILHDGPYSAITKAPQRPPW